MKEEDLIERLRKAEYQESYFSKIMHAKKVQDIIDIQATPEEILSYFSAIERLGSIEEECIFFVKIAVQRLRDAPVEKNRRAFLI